MNAKGKSQKEKKRKFESKVDSRNQSQNQNQEKRASTIRERFEILYPEEKIIIKEHSRSKGLRKRNQNKR